MEIQKVIPGFKQVDRITQYRLIQQLALFGYHPVARTLSLWQHATNFVQFALVVDNFGVKYTSETDFNYLIASLNRLYTTTVDRIDSKFLSTTLDWCYEADRHVDLSMPDSVAKAFRRFIFFHPLRTSHAPHK